FAEYLSVLHRKASQLHKAKAGRNFRDGYGLTVCRQERPSRLRQPQHSKMPAGRQTVDFVKCLAKRPLTYRKCPAQRRNVQWLVQGGERQSLRVLAGVSACVASRSERRFRSGSEPLMNVHGKPPAK